MIIGFTGQAGCGKDTAGLILIRKLRYTKVSFATPIKDGLSKIFEWPAAFLAQNHEEREKPFMLGDLELPSPRIMMQTLGTEWGRQCIHEDIWVALAQRQIEEENLKRVVFTDIRFPNEAKWIQAMGGWVIEVIRPNAPGVAEHKSEAGLSHNLIDFTIMNDGSQSQFEKNVLKEVQDKMRAEDKA